MSSQINPSSISTNFPVPGVNQSSQGFRSNFLATQNGLSEAVAELNDLFNKVIVSAPLVYGNNNSGINNFGGMQNSNLSLFDFALVTSDIPASTANSVPTLSFSSIAVANISITSGTPVTQTINVANFPTLGYSELILQVEATTVPQFLNFSGIVPGGSITTSGKSGIAGFNTSTANFAITTTNPYIIKISSTDGLNYILDSSTAAVAKLATPSNIGALGDTAGMIAYDSNYIYVCIANYDGITTIWKKSAIA
jgi:hypothetical protein